MIDYDGPQCQGNCPNRGCVETLVSGVALARDARQAAEAHPDSMLGRLLAAGRVVDSRELISVARAGDGIAEQLVERAGALLGVAMSSYSNTFGPERFVIGGGVAAAGEMLLAPARREYSSRALAPVRSASVEPAQLGVDAGVVGAAIMALEQNLAGTGLNLVSA